MRITLYLKHANTIGNMYSMSQYTHKAVRPISDHTNKDVSLEPNNVASMLKTVRFLQPCCESVTVFLFYICF